MHKQCLQLQELYSVKLKGDHNIMYNVAKEDSKRNTTTTMMVFVHITQVVTDVYIIDDNSKRRLQ